jgi:hypothetical protein
MGGVVFLLYLILSHIFFISWRKFLTNTFNRIFKIDVKKEEETIFVLIIQYISVMIITYIMILLLTIIFLHGDLSYEIIPYNLFRHLGNI